jgi:hypothetical protein
MSFLSHEATQLASSLKAASAYAQQARGNLDLSDPKAAARLRHVQAVEAAVQGAIDFATAADKLLNPPPPPLVACLSEQPAAARIPAPHPRSPRPLFCPPPAPQPLPR